MRIAVTGATGNLGTSVLGALSNDDAIEEVVGIARRIPDLELPKVRWEAGDVRSSDLATLFSGADAVVHLAWAVQPSHEPHALRATNVRGSERVFDAAAEAGVRTIIYASSVGAYSPGPKDDPVDEQWPTDGVHTSEYSRDKAEVERALDRFEEKHPDIRCVRLRPSLIFKRESGAELIRLFLGPFVPTPLFRLNGLPVVPSTTGLAIQAVHASDVAAIVRKAIHEDIRGAYNLAAEPALTPDVVAKTLRLNTVPIPRKALRLLALTTWQARVQPTDPGWVDLAFESPLLSTDKAKADLGWAPAVNATQALSEIFEGVTHSQKFATPAMSEARKPFTGALRSLRSRLPGPLGAR